MSETLSDMITRHEGKKNKMYPDSLGIPTIGVGHNLSAKPISDRAVKVILEDDIQDATNGLLKNLPWAGDLDLPRKFALIDMYFNMEHRLLGFHKFLEHLQNKEWEKAGDEMMDSVWAKQVGKRAEDLKRIILTGEMN